MIIGLEYIKYRLKAKGRHGIHSPFVYELVDSCFKLNIDEKSKKLLQKLFERYSSDQSLIEIDDHGAGSHKLKTSRKVSDIFKTSSSKGKYGELLYKLAKHYQFNTVLEFGTSLGVGTSYFHLGNQNAKITTIEACSITRSVVLKLFEEEGFENILSLECTFDEYLEQPIYVKFDCVYIDGHHDGSALIKYLARLKDQTHEETIFILDDIRWSDSMLSAWKEIIANEEYHLTIDLFRVGIICRRPHQLKEHFTIKI